MTNYLSEGKVPYFISKLYGNIPVASHDECESLFDEYVVKPITMNPALMTQSDFEKLSWGDIKELSKGYNAESKSDYEKILGFTKPLEIAGYGTVDMQLVSFDNYEPTNTGETAHFVMLSRQCPTTSTLATSNTYYTDWSTGNVCKLLTGSMLDAIDAGIMNLITEVNVPYNYRSTATSYSKRSKDVKLFTPSAFEMAGVTDYMNAAEMRYEWFEIHDDPGELVRYNLDGSPLETYLRDVGLSTRGVCLTTSGSVEICSVVKNYGVAIGFCI